MLNLFFFKDIAFDKFRKEYWESLQALTECTDPEKESVMRQEFNNKFFINPDYSDKMKQQLGKLTLKIKAFRNKRGKKNEIQSPSTENKMAKSVDGISHVNPEDIMEVQKRLLHSSPNTIHNNGGNTTKLSPKSSTPSSSVTSNKYSNNNVAQEKQTVSVQPLNPISAPKNIKPKAEKTLSTTPKVPFKPKQKTNAKLPSKKVAPKNNSAPKTALKTKLPVNKPLLALALFDFEAQNERELDFKSGARITILDNSHEEWWKGALDNGSQGWFPKNYCSLGQSKN